MKRFLTRIMLAALAAVVLSRTASASERKVVAIKPLPKATITSIDSRLLNPQPLPPRAAVRLRSVFDRYMLNPQPLPPRIALPKVLILPIGK